MRDWRMIEAKPLLGLAKVPADQIAELVDRYHYLCVE